LLTALGCGGVEPEDAGERGEEYDQACRAGQIAAEVGAERGEADCDGHEAHHRTEQRPSVALDRLANGRLFVVGALQRAHVTTPKGTGRRAGG
jgi:hypothetical protein